MTDSEQKTSNNNSHLLDDEIDLKQLFNTIWEARKFIISITSLVAISAIIYSLLLTNYYRSESILVATDLQSSSTLSQYADFAAIAGIGLPTERGDGVIEVMEIIQSREFVKHLLTFEDILPSLMASKSYDAVSKELYFDPKLYDMKSKTWIREPSGNKGIEPSYLETHEAYLGEVLSISQDIKTGLVYIAIEHISPVFAKEFLALIIKEANSLMREKDIDTSNKALSYLEQELSQTRLVEIKESINQLIESQLETRMMAQISEEYSLSIIEPPFIPEEKSKPFRSLIVILATIIGGLLGMIIVLVRSYVSNKVN
tara:strand:- start:22350 stop:23294 length:945 start_codon:yes stop_codon:yes gene_type:complete